MNYPHLLPEILFVFVTAAVTLASWFYMSHKRDIRLKDLAPEDLQSYGILMGALRIKLEQPNHQVSSWVDRHMIQLVKYLISVTNVDFLRDLLKCGDIMRLHLLKECIEQNKEAVFKAFFDGSLNLGDLRELRKCAEERGGTNCSEILELIEKEIEKISPSSPARSSVRESLFNRLKVSFIADKTKKDERRL